MLVIKPVSDLRNYPEVLKDVKSGSPVYLTKNGTGRYVLIDIADYNSVESRTGNEDVAPPRFYKSLSSMSPLPPVKTMNIH
jgi:prevent-host-death family protein